MSVFCEVVTLLYVCAYYLRFARRSLRCASLRASLKASRFAIAINSNGLTSATCCSLARRLCFARPVSFL